MQAIPTSADMSYVTALSSTIIARSSMFNMISMTKIGSLSYFLMCSFQLLPTQRYESSR